MHNPNQPKHDHSPPERVASLTLPFKSLIAFFVRFLLIFIAFLVLWFPFADGYGWLFRTSGNILVGQGSQGRVWFERPDSADAHHDVQLIVVEPKERVKRTTEISSRRHGYMPTSFLLALTLAAPVGWPRRLWSALWALLWVNVYVAAKLTLFPIAYVGGDPIGAMTLAGVLRRILWVLGASSVGWMLVPLLIWAILTFRLLFRPSADTSS